MARNKYFKKCIKWWLVGFSAEGFTYKLIRGFLKDRTVSLWWDAIRKINFIVAMFVSVVQELIEAELQGTGFNNRIHRFQVPKAQVSRTLFTGFKNRRHRFQESKAQVSRTISTDFKNLIHRFQEPKAQVSRTISTDFKNLIHRFQEPKAQVSRI